MSDLTIIHQQYAKDVLAGKIIACKYIKSACSRYISFFDKYTYDENKVQGAINFISKLKHFTGKHNNKPFILQPWQVWIISAIFGFYKSDGKRLTNSAYIEVSRKSGKTAFAAAIALYMMVADGESNAEVDFLANNSKQASIAFDMASNFLQSIDPKGKYFERYRSKIKFDKLKSFIQVLSSDASGLDGFNPHLAVLDEIHEYRDSKLYDVMVSGQGARANPLILCISTAGFNKFLFAYPYRKSCIEIVSGLKEDDSFFGAFYTLDEDDDWKDENVWKKACPNLDITVNKDYIKRQITSATNTPSLEVSVKTKNLNVWCDSSDVWISHDLLMESSKKINLSDFDFETLCWMGVDLSAVSDMTAISAMIPYEGKYYFKTYYYLPESCLQTSPNANLYYNWQQQGYLKLTSGNVVDYDEIIKDFQNVSQQLLIDKIAYDSYNSTQWAIEMTNLNMPIEPYSQALFNFNRPTKTFERLIKMGKVVIDDNPITRWCFANVTLKEDHNENIKPIKGEGKNNKIDGVISMIEALGIYLDQPQYSTEIGTISFN